MSTHESELEQMARSLEESGEFRVLRRLHAHRKFNENPEGKPTRLGLLVDVETTGTNSQTDEIIELAMVPFTYTLDGMVVETMDHFSSLREPSIPIPDEVIAITGITNEDVRGHSIDPAEVEDFIEPASLIIAHNAGFDRRFLERFTDGFIRKPWACSMSQIPWQAEGLEGTKLAYLVMGFGLFHDGHRATDDCLATLEIMSRPLPRSGETGLTKLLAAARTPTWRLWASRSPIETKDVLKARGYRWNNDGVGDRRAWFIDLADHDQIDTEIDFLRRMIFKRDQVSLPIDELTAMDRFSERG